MGVKEFERRNINIVISNSELGAPHSGTASGPEFLLKAIFRNEKPAYPVTLVEIENLYDEKFPNAKNIDSLLSNVKASYQTIREILSAKQFPFILSGDHSNAISSIAAFSDEFGSEELGLIWIDAHADLHTPATTPSGNVHGMPLGAMLNLDELNENPVKNKELNQLWEAVKDPGNTKGLPKLKPENLVIIGLRSTEEEETEAIKNLGIRCFKPKEIENTGIEKVFENTLSHLSNCSKLLVSFDTDSLDKLLVPGTGTPVLNGLSLEQAQLLIRMIWDLPQLSGFEITEFNPTLDKDHITLQNLLKIFQPILEV